MFRQWHDELCEEMMEILWLCWIKLKIDGLEDHRMKFQRQERGEPADFDY